MKEQSKPLTHKVVDTTVFTADIMQGDKVRTTLSEETHRSLETSVNIWLRCGKYKLGEVKEVTRQSIKIG